MSRFKKKPAGINGGYGLSSNGLVRLAGVAALAAGSVGGIVLASSTAYASTSPVTIPSGTYTVGSGSVTGFTVTPGSAYVVSFKATDGISTSSGSDPGSVSVSLPGTTITNTNGSAFNAGVSALVSVNGSEVGFASFVSSTSASSVTMMLPTVVNSGDTVQIQFIGVSNPNETSATPEIGTIATSNDPLTVDASYTIPQSSSAFAATASNSALGVSNVTYNIGPIDVMSSSSTTGLGSSSSDPFSLTFTSGSASDPSVTLPGAAGQYTVSVTNSSGTKSTDTVTSAAPTNNTTEGTSSVALVLTTPLAVGDTVNVTVVGVINPSSPTTSVTVTDSVNTGDSSSILYGTQIGSLTTSLMPPTSASTGSTTANLVTSFVSTDAMSSSSSNNYTVITLPSGLAFTTTNTQAAVTVGSGSSAVTSEGTVTYTGYTGNTGNTVATVTMPSVNAGQQVAITVFGVSVTGSSGTNSYTVGVATGADSLTAYGTATEDFTVASGNVPVVLSNTGLQASSNYTISGLEATAAIPADTNTVGNTFGTGNDDYELELAFPSKTSLPTSASDYTITDSTNSSGSGQVSGVAVSGSDVYLTVANNIAENDVFSIAVDGAINPAQGSNNYSIGITGNVEAQPAAVSTTVPNATMTYPNGALIQSGGQIDVVAGGYAFGIPTPTVLGDIMKMDHSSVQSGTFPTATMPAPGTLINPVGTSGYWVVGTNGDIYQFSSMSQFMKDGYVASQVIPVPNAGGLTAGAGAPPNAAVTMANGALVQFGSTVYEYAGGVPTGIQTPAQLASIQKMTGATVVTGSGSTPTAAPTSANGTLVQPLGKAGVWVSNGGTLYQFMTSSQFTTDGYSFQYVLPVATVGSYMTSSI
jgi:hypothetical protein